MSDEMPTTLAALQQELSAPLSLDASAFEAERYMERAAIARKLTPLVAQESAQAKQREALRLSLLDHS